MVRGKNQAGIDVEKATRKGEGVHFVVIDDLHDERHFTVGVLDKNLRLAIHILSNCRVRQQARTLLHLERQLSAQRDLLLERKKVDPLAYLAIPDTGRIV